MEDPRAGRDPNRGPQRSRSRYCVDTGGEPAEGERLVWGRLLQYPAQAMFVMLVIVCLTAPLVVGGIAWRTQRQLEQIGAEAEHGAQLREVDRLLQHLVADQRAGGQHPDSELIDQARIELTAVRLRQLNLRGAANPRLDRVGELLGPAEPSRGELRQATRILGEVVHNEETGHRELLSRLRVEIRTELETATALFLALALIGLGGGWVVQRRILHPLRDLRTMFLKLGAGDFSPVALGGVHPVLAPLFNNYNLLVTRLGELEEEHRSRAEDLHHEVRSAAEALLAQQRTLARAERLAAVGEMAAGLAHELRNPLAGVQLSLVNLRRDLDNPQLASRLELAIAELERLTRLLNHQLSAARHVPESPQPLQLRKLVEELFALLRYQVPTDIDLEAQVEDNLECRLPRDRLRQALLNIVLNSVQALGDNEGRVRLDAHREGKQLILVVTDNGPGFPPELLQAGGAAFVTQRSGGTGLGLAMVRRLAADLGGELILENREPRGARVRLALPCGTDNA